MNLTLKEYEDIKKQIRKITRGENPELVDDFIQDVLLMFLEHPKHQELKESGEWKYFVIRIALNNWRSSTSKWYYKYKKIKYVEMDTNQTIKDEVYDYEKDDLHEKILQGLDQMYKSDNEKHRYEAIIILLYYSTGESFTKLGTTLNQDRTTIGKTFKKGLKTLQTYLNISDLTPPQDISTSILKSGLLKDITIPKVLTQREIYEEWIRENRILFFNSKMRTKEHHQKVYEIYNYFYNTNEQPTGCGLCISEKYNHFKDLYF